MKQTVEQMTAAFQTVSLRTKKNLVLVGLSTLVLLSGLTSFHTVSSAVLRTSHNPVTLDTPTQRDYTEQIQSFLEYDSMDGMRWERAYENRGHIHVHLFDGYATSIFVFENERLSYLGSTTTPDLLSVDSDSLSLK